MLGLSQGDKNFWLRELMLKVAVLSADKHQQKQNGAELPHFSTLLGLLPELLLLPTTLLLTSTE